MKGFDVVSSILDIKMAAVDNILVVFCGFLMFVPLADGQWGPPPDFEFGPGPDGPPPWVIRRHMREFIF